MENRVAEIISYIFHPLLMPLYVLFFFLNTPVFIFYEYSLNLKLILTGYVFLLTFVVPGILIVVLKRSKAIESFKMETKQERVMPLAFMSIIYYITYYFLNELHVMNIFSVFLLGITLLTLFTLLINFYTKISLHMIGVGSVTGVVLGLVIKFPEVSPLILYFVILTSGIVAYARIYISNHTVRQLFYGYILGFLVMVSLMIF